MTRAETGADAGVVLAGPADPLTAAALARRLAGDGIELRRLPDPTRSTPLPPSWGLVLAPGAPPAQTVDSLSVEDLLQRLDDAFAMAAALARQGLAGGTLRRIVLLAGIEARGIAGGSVAAALGGGFTALARSWALELSGDGVTANAILAAPTDSHPTIAPGVAEAAAFLLSPRSGAVSGQVLRISADTDAGILPI